MIEVGNVAYMMEWFDRMKRREVNRGRTAIELVHQATNAVCYIRMAEL